jgi:diacylglycerol kinase family enzyme
MTQSVRPDPRELSPATSAAQRWLARLTFVVAAAAAAVLLIGAGLRASVGLFVLGAAGIAIQLAGVYFFLSRRGILRQLAAAVVVLVPFVLAFLFTRAGLAWVVAVFALLCALTVVAGRAALRRTDATAGPVEHESQPPGHPHLIMNPRSGGGQVVRLHLAERARELGAEVTVLTDPADPHTGPADPGIAELARRAIRDGADLLGVAGGDGTQALVAGVAAELGVPFLVIPAGTRNHFALDLGLDIHDPVSCLDALSDGVELRVDLGRAGTRTFVNNVSFGAYADAVQSPAYRGDKTRTVLDVLPDRLTGRSGPELRVRAGGTVLVRPPAVLISNNPYASDNLTTLGRRHRLDSGRLGVLAVLVDGAGSAASLLRGRRSSAVSVFTADEVTIESDESALVVGIDGEAGTVPTPVVCAIAPGALRVRVPRHRPGLLPERPGWEWTRLRRLALSTGRR